MKKNKTWLLLRGLTRAQEHWLSFPELLKKEFPNDQVVLLDLPGNGRRYNETSPIQISDYTKDIRSQIQIQGPLNIIALSLGAMVTIDWLQRYPNELDEVFLVNTSCKNTGHLFQRFKPNNYLSIISALFKDSKSRELEVLKMTSNDLNKHEQVIDQFSEWAQKYPIKVENFSRQLIAASQFKIQNTLDPKNKVNLIVSQLDRLVSCENTFNLAQIWGLKPHVHPWAGHDLVLDDPEFMLKIVKNQK